MARCRDCRYRVAEEGACEPCIAVRRIQSLVHSQALPGWTEEAAAHLLEGAAAVLVALADGPPARGGSEDEDEPREASRTPLRRSRGRSRSRSPASQRGDGRRAGSGRGGGNGGDKGKAGKGSNRGRRDRRGPGKGKGGGDQGRQQRDQRLAGAVAQATAAAHVFFQAVVTLAEYRDTASVTEGSPASPPSANPDVPGFLRSALRAALVQALRQVRDWLALLRAARGSAANSRAVAGGEADDERRMQAACARVRKGEVSRQLLTAAELVPGTEATWEALTDPERRPPEPRDHMPSDVIAFTPDALPRITPDALAAALRTSKRGSAPGLSGMRAEHLQVLLQDAEGLELLAYAGTCLARAEVPSEVAAPYAAAHDEALWDTLLRCLGGSPPDGLAYARDVASLPAAMGGLGLCSASRVSPAAYWAGWADALTVIQTRRAGFTEARVAELSSPAHGPGPPSLREAEAARAQLQAEGDYGP
ncbi:unnamed protein product [Effrenium voratum]|nr:unnamed protein product [Effrenium voratum]